MEAEKGSDGAHFSPGVVYGKGPQRHGKWRDVSQAGHGEDLKTLTGIRHSQAFYRSGKQIHQP